jgi:hypothetical protein
MGSVRKLDLCGLSSDGESLPQHRTTTLIVGAEGNVMPAYVVMLAAASSSPSETSAIRLLSSLGTSMPRLLWPMLFILVARFYTMLQR